jgi:branched-chain amino acid transport system ATP-binding protein
MSNRTFLRVSDADVYYGRKQILRDIDLELDQGGIISLIGRNGVGKTTLMKTIIGLKTPQIGEVVYRGEDVTNRDADDRARRGIGYVPQGREVFPKMTVQENIKMGQLVNEDTKDMLYDKVYEYFPILEERAGQKAGTLSGGEQQMLAIGRAMVGGPDLLLLDEPSEGIQPTIVQRIGESLQEINRELDITIFFSEQNIDLASTASSHCYVMDKGTIVDYLSTERLENSDVVQDHLKI